MELEARDRISRHREKPTLMVATAPTTARLAARPAPRAPVNEPVRMSRVCCKAARADCLAHSLLPPSPRSLPLSVLSSGLGAFPSSYLSPTADCSRSYRIWDGQPGKKVCHLVHFMETQHALCPTMLMVSIHTLRRLFMSNWFKMT